MKKSKHISIETELFKNSTLLSVAIVLILGVFFSFMFYKAQLSSANELIKQRNQSVNFFIDGFFSTSLNTINFLSKHHIAPEESGFSEIEKSKLLKLYRNINDVNEHITYVYSGTKNKALYINDYIPPEDYDPVTRPWYQSALKSNPEASICEPYKDINTKKWLIATSKALLDKNGNTFGVVSVDSDMDILANLLKQRHSVYKSSYSYVLKDNLIIVHHDKSLIKENFYDNVKTPSPITFDEPEGTFTYLYKGVKKLAFYSKIKKNGWVVITVINTDEVLNPILKKTGLYILAVLLVSLAWARLQSTSLSRKIVTPLLQLKMQMESIVSGSSDTDKKWQYPNNEIGQIAQKAAQLAQTELLAKNIDLQEKKNDLERLSNTDQLTQINNRRKLELELLRAFELYKRYQTQMSLLIIDIDHFKKINDVYGHSAGDKVLIELASVLQANVRATDIPGRWGGEEFIVVCPNVNISDVAANAQKLCDIVRSHIFSIQVQLTISIGAAQLQAGQTINNVLETADKNLYKAKEMGRDQIVAN